MRRANERRWYVRCKDSRMPLTPLARADAEHMAEVCDENWPECGPHEVVSGRAAHVGYE